MGYNSLSFFLKMASKTASIFNGFLIDLIHIIISLVGPIGSILKTSRRVYMRLFYTLFPGCSCYFTFRPIHSVSLEEDKCTLLIVINSSY